MVRNGEIVPATIMSVTLSCDHRAIDGALGAELITAFKKLIENPVMMVVLDAVIRRARSFVLGIRTAHGDRCLDAGHEPGMTRMTSGSAMADTPSTSSSSAPAPAAMSPPSAPPSSASRSRWSSAISSAASARTGAASRPRRCCARPKSIHYMQHAKDYGLSADNVVVRSGRRHQALARRRRPHEQRRRLPDEEEQGHGDLGRGDDRRARQDHREGLQDRSAERQRSVPASYQAKHIIVATGARPRVLPGLEPDKKLVWTYFEAMNPDKMPKSLLVVGSGAIGIEFASFYRTMGAEVTVVEVLPQILPVEDAEIAAFARKQFEKQGIKIIANAKVTKLDKKADSVTATIEEGGKTHADHRRPRHRRGRRRRQYREPRAGKARRQNRPRLHRHRRRLQDQRAGHLRHRRCRRSADAGAQGRA